MKHQKKAQSGMNAAVLVSIIAGLIIIYILFLPSNERLNLVDNETEFGNNGDTLGDNILLEDNQIIMEVVNDREIEHDLPSVNLFTSTEASVIEQENSIYIKNGIFEKQGKTIDFRVKDPDNTDNLLISFDAKKSKGRLIIKINDQEIYNKDIDKINADPIKIPKDVLAERNDLSLEVSGVGIAFWSTNEYLIENFKITGDITDTSTQESELKFIVPRSESGNIEKAEIKFVPECQPTNVGLLDILVNNNVIYSSVPDCGVARPLEFSPNNIITGENKLVFRSQKGRYLIDQIKVTTELMDQPSYTYFFDIDSEDFKDIENGKKNLNLTLFFVDDREYKEGEIIINNHKRFMTRHHEFDWSINLDSFVEEGSNSLKIIPEERLEIRKLLVKLDDED